jgi:hypothetical protein
MDLEIIPEWRTKYLDYKKLKKQISKIKEEALLYAKALAKIAGNLMTSLMRK